MLLFLWYTKTNDHLLGRDRRHETVRIMLEQGIVEPVKVRVSARDGRTEELFCVRIFLFILVIIEKK